MRLHHLLCLQTTGSPRGSAHSLSPASTAGSSGHRGVRARGRSPQPFAPSPEAHKMDAPSQGLSAPHRPAGAHKAALVRLPSRSHRRERGSPGWRCPRRRLSLPHSPHMTNPSRWQEARLPPDGPAEGLPSSRQPLIMRPRCLRAHWPGPGPDPGARRGQSSGGGGGPRRFAPRPRPAPPARGAASRPARGRRAEEERRSPVVRLGGPPSARCLRAGQPLAWLGRGSCPRSAGSQAFKNTPQLASSPPSRAKSTATRAKGDGHRPPAEDSQQQLPELPAGLCGPSAIAPFVRKAPQSLPMLQSCTVCSFGLNTDRAWRCPAMQMWPTQLCLFWPNLWRFISGSLFWVKEQQSMRALQRAATGTATLLAKVAQAAVWTHVIQAQGTVVKLKSKGLVYLTSLFVENL